MSQKINHLKTIFTGIAIGIIFTGSAMWIAMPKMMLSVHQSKYNTVDETCDKLKASIEAHGWSSPAIRNMNMATEKHGVHMNKQVRIVELCKADYAKDILQTNPEVSTLMPCAWGVYEGEDGNIYISGMNMGLMGRMFGGNIARIMGGFVSLDEKNMLKDVVL